MESKKTGKFLWVVVIAALVAAATTVLVLMRFKKKKQELCCYEDDFDYDCDAELDEAVAEAAPVDAQIEE